MAKLAAENKQLSVENDNLIRLLQVHIAKVDDKKGRTLTKFLKQDVMTTPKMKAYSKGYNIDKGSSQDYQIYENEQGEWREYDDDDPNRVHYEKHDMSS